MKNKKKSRSKGEKRGINAVLKKYQRDRDNLIPILQGIQRKNGYISKEAVNEISNYLDISENEIYGIVTFYTQFRFQRPGDHIVKVCLGTACHVQGGARILESVERELGIKPGEITPDHEFDLERVACVGCCALAPVVVADNKVYGKMTTNKVKKVIADEK